MLSPHLRRAPEIRLPLDPVQSSTNFGALESTSPFVFILKLQVNNTGLDLALQALCYFLVV
jgi:hypothetical protein